MPINKQTYKTFLNYLWLFILSKSRLCQDNCIVVTSYEWQDSIYLDLKILSRKCTMINNEGIYNFQSRFWSSSGQGSLKRPKQIWNTVSVEKCHKNAFDCLLELLSHQQWHYVSTTALLCLQSKSKSLYFRFRM